MLTPRLTLVCGDAVSEDTEIKLKFAHSALSDLACELETAQGEVDITNAVVAVQQQQTNELRVGEFSGCSLSLTLLSLSNSYCCCTKDNVHR